MQQGTVGPSFRQCFQNNAEISTSCCSLKVDRRSWHLDGTEDKQKLDKVRMSVEEIFGVTCRERALQELCDTSCPRNSVDYPVFIPASAKIAFVFRAGSAMTEEEFEAKMRPEHYDDYGVMQFGEKPWENMDRKQQSSAFYDVVQNVKFKDFYEDRHAFNKILLVLERSVEISLVS